MLLVENVGDENGLDILVVTALPILAIGDSHMECVAGRDIWDDHASFKSAPGREGIFFLKGGMPRDEKYWSLAAELASRHRLLMFWGGSEHYMTFLIQADEPFDFCCDELPHLPLDMEAQIVPRALVVEHFRACVAPMAAVLQRLGAAAASCWVVSPPPPKRLGDREIRERLELYFLAQALRLGVPVDQVQFSPPTLMLKLWHALQAAQRDIAARCGVAFLPPPPCAVDPNGFLRPEFWRSDITHANEHYGTAVLELLRHS